MGCKDIQIRKSGFVTKTQFLCIKTAPSNYKPGYRKEIIDYWYEVEKHKGTVIVISSDLLFKGGMSDLQLTLQTFIWSVLWKISSFLAWKVFIRKNESEKASHFIKKLQLKIINFKREEDGYFINSWSDRPFKGTVKLWIGSMKEESHKIIDFEREEDEYFINSWSDRAFKGTVKLWIGSMKGESHKIINFEREEDGCFINSWSDRVFKGTVKLWIGSMKEESHKIMFTVPLLR